MELKIEIGEYLLTQGRLQAKLIVKYQERTFEIQWLSSEHEHQMEEYLNRFAQEMIASKSTRNFYKPQKKTN